MSRTAATSEIYQGKQHRTDYLAMQNSNYTVSYLVNTTPSMDKMHVGTVATSAKQASTTPHVMTLKVIAVTCFLCVIIAIAVFGNSFALVAFRISKELRRVAYYFIINLCISDLLVALLSMPFWISYLLTGWPSNKSGAVYTIWICLDIFLGTWSIISLAVISMERYVCIIYSLRYKNMVTKKRAWYAVAFILAYSAFTSCLGYVQISLNKSIVSTGIFVLAYVIPVLIKMFTYRKIYSEARRQRQFTLQEAKDRKRLCETELTMTNDISTVRSSSGNQGKSNGASHMKS